MNSFALIGAAGYVAPRHMKAISETGNDLLASLDIHDNVGILDSFFPKADFFIEFERFDRHISKLRYEKNIELDYISICTPNYLHDSHIRFALRQEADAICEKPLVLNPWNLDALLKIQKETGKKIYTILQLRLHPSVIALRERIMQAPKNKVFDVDLTYLTSRGNWYFTSWKGDMSKSGGIATNIGIHFFDMLSWIFGDLKENRLHIDSHDRSAGYLEFEKARVRWFLSINRELLPDFVKTKGLSTYRSIRLDGEEFEFSQGFSDLHTESYKKIIAGNGFGVEDSRSAVEIVHAIRNSSPLGPVGDFHPLAKKELTQHPFTMRQDNRN